MTSVQTTDSTHLLDECRVTIIKENQRRPDHKPHNTVNMILVFTITVGDESGGVAMRQDREVEEIVDVLSSP